MSSVHKSVVVDSLRFNPPDHFVADAGLLPSRLRKSRPASDFGFLQSQMRAVRPVADSAGLSTAVRNIIERSDVRDKMVLMPSEYQAGLPLISYRSSWLESRFSSCQSQSLQSSLELHTVTGSACVLVFDQYTLVGISASC
ncbi:hypothetical protein FBUS_11680 [Fasciolopsis buskii]|uniref:Uncharacterized protein n=1 Tax=Fasciolopsis buskii TaxID=27845 RepID=A0A8E0VDI8_9TREM|nr:hypothetical protein FBUS_11680 [Fasciolopsis buski]